MFSYTHHPLNPQKTPCIIPTWASYGLYILSILVLNLLQNLQKSPHILPLRAIYELSVVSILQTIDHVIIGSYCIHQVSMNMHGNEANCLAPAEHFHMPATTVSLSEQEDSPLGAYPGTAVKIWFWLEETCEHIAIYDNASFAHKSLSFCVHTLFTLIHSTHIDDLMQERHNSNANLH